MKKFNVGIKGVIRRDDGAVLLLKKNKGEKSFWEVPGGRIDGDETIQQALIRELHEELPGTKDIVMQRVLIAHRLPFDIAEDLGLMLLYFEVSATLSEPITISEEHSEYMWVNTIDEVPLEEGTLKALKEVFTFTK